jgi:hypothetical protein
MRHFLFGWTNSIGSSIRDDVQTARLVDLVDDRCQRRRLARSRRTGHKYQSAADGGDAAYLLRQSELLDRHDLLGDHAKDSAAAALLPEEIHAVASRARDLVREVDVAAFHILIP